MDRRIRGGYSAEDAWNMTSIELVQCAEVSMFLLPPAMEISSKRAVINAEIKINFGLFLCHQNVF